MKINIICIGKIKEKYLTDAIAEYSKRLSKFCELNIIEIKEEIGKIEEGKLLIDKINAVSGKDKTSTINIALTLGEKEYDTMQLAERIKNYKLNRKSTFNYIIGGSDGLSDEVLKIVDDKISLSKLTFPHQLFRVILLEQIYRIFKIETGEPYHK